MNTLRITGMAAFLLLFALSAPAQTYDDFESQTLSPVWSWVREYTPNWKLDSGYMTIMTERGALNSERFNNVRNILLQDVPDEDVIRMETKLLFSPVFWQEYWCFPLCFYTSTLQGFLVFSYVV